MFNRATATRLIARVLDERWRTTAALGASLVIHLLIYFSYAPDYESVKDVAIQFELVQGEDQQPAAPEASGPRSVDPPPAGIAPEDEKPDAEPIPPEPAGLLVGDTDFSAKDTGDLPTDTDTSSMTQKDSSTEDTAPSDTATETETDSGTDTANAADSDMLLATDSATGDTAPQIATGNDTGAESDSDTSTVVANRSSESDSDTGTSATDAASKGTDTASPDNGICLHDVFAYGKPNPRWMAWLSMSAFAGTRFESSLSDILRSYYLYTEMVSATEIDPLTELEGLLISADDFSDFSTYEVVTTYNVGQDTLRDRLQKNKGARPDFQMSSTPQGISGIQTGGYRWDMVGSGRVMVAADAKKGGLQPNWPKAVTCMMPRPEFAGAFDRQFNALVRSRLGPQKAGERWPVLMMATRDPGAVGLAYRPELARKFEWATIKGYFSDPIQLVGEAKFKGSPADMAEVDALVKSLLSQSFYLKLLGFGSVVDNLEYHFTGTTLHFTIPMTAAQAEAMLKLATGYSQKLNTQFSKPKN